MTGFTCLELCAGGGGQAIGLERAGFAHERLIEIDPDACATLRRNRPDWPVVQGDIRELAWLENPHYSHRERTTGLVAAGLPCTPHSRGGRQLGRDDERHLWETALQIISWARPRAVLLETSSSIMAARFDADRARTLGALERLGYRWRWRIIDCSWFGIPQRRRRAVLAAFSDRGAAASFSWPQPHPGPPPGVGRTLYPLARAGHWPGAYAWSAGNWDSIAPVVTGGSRKHGGADLGASQGKAAWRNLDIDPMGIADGPPGPDGKYQRGRGIIRDAEETGLMLTVEMAARLQGFPPDWKFSGTKTARYRQVGNAFPPPAAEAIGRAIAAALTNR